MSCAWLYYEYGYERIIGNTWYDGWHVFVCFPHDLVSLNMKVGDLVRNVHDDSYHGIIIETAPIETRIDHGDNVCKVRWFDGDVSFEFLKVLVVLSESR